MKLVLVINTLEKGGAERVLSSLGNSLSNRAYEVTIVCLNTAVPGYPITEKVKVVSLLDRKNKDTGFQRIRYAALTGIRFSKFLRSAKPDFVISFMTSANLWTGTCCLLLNIPYAVSERTTPDHTLKCFNTLMKRFSYFIYKHSRAIVTPAKGIEDCMKSYPSFNRLNNYKVIRNPIFDFKTVHTGQVHSRNYILGVGRLSVVKGFDLLIMAFNSLRHLDIDLLIVGEGAARQSLCKLISDLDLQGRVILTGAKDNLRSYYEQAEVFVLPSRNEGYPNALIEAMSLGCACVAFDCEFGPSEIIENKVNGVLIANQNIAMLSQGILKILNDPVYQHKLKNRARLIRQNNDLEVISSQWEDLILFNS
jgi:glycosyltransferase involved in cell wall biosynthesis